MILCASGLRFVAGSGEPKRLVRLAADAGFDGIAIGPDCGLRDVTALCTAALSTGLSVPVVSAPLAEGPLAEGRRLPHLASLDDDDERRAAITLFSSLLDLVVPLGAGVLAVNLGDVVLGAQADAVAHRFARRELEEGEPGERLWEAAVGERRALSGLVLDACRYALDQILPLAERRAVRLALEVAGGPWGTPSPREALSLLDEYSGGPLGVVWDDARMQVLATLGIAPAPQRRPVLAAAAAVWRANDAVGIDAGYLPGLGDPPSPDVDFTDDQTGDPFVAPALPPGILVVVTGHPYSTTAEVTEARARVASTLELARTEVPPTPATGPSPGPASRY